MSENTCYLPSTPHWRLPSISLPYAGRRDVVRTTYLQQSRFPSWWTGPELSSWERVQNEYLHVMAFPHLGNAATAAVDELGRSSARSRLHVSNQITATVREITAKMADLI